MPKPTATRQRRNRASTHSTLHLVPGGMPVPPLPERLDNGPKATCRLCTHAHERHDQEHSATCPCPAFEPRQLPWHELTLSWWHDVWASPMAPEFLEADRHGLFILADLVDRYWHAPRPDLAAEIRLQRRDFGLTPLDRRRLQWEVERAEEAMGKRKPERAVRRGSRAVLEALS